MAEKFNLLFVILDGASSWQRWHLNVSMSAIPLGGCFKLNMPSLTQGWSNSVYLILSVWQFLVYMQEANLGRKCAAHLQTLRIYFPRGPPPPNLRSIVSIFIQNAIYLRLHLHIYSVTNSCNFSFALLTVCLPLTPCCCISSTNHCIQRILLLSRQAEGCIGWLECFKNISQEFWTL